MVETFKDLEFLKEQSCRAFYKGEMSLEQMQKSIAYINAKIDKLKEGLK